MLHLIYAMGCTVQLSKNLGNKMQFGQTKGMRFAIKIVKVKICCWWGSNLNHLYEFLLVLYLSVYSWKF